MAKSRFLIIVGTIILLFDLIYNLLYKPIYIGYYNIMTIIFGLSFLIFGVVHEEIIMIFRKIDKLFETRTYHVLFIVLTINILIRLLFLPERWINPDEGAHLYDAKFILDGKIPIVDYGSRMPVYVYTLAAFLKVFGVSYLEGRLMPLFSNIGIGILVFLIGNKLFNSRKVALLASAIYLFSPLSILWSVVVKTEQLETLFVTIGMFLLLTYIKLEKEKYNIIFLSGFFFALGYYVRESAIMVLIASLLIVAYVYRFDTYKAFKTNGAMLLGYLTVVFLIFVYFSSFMGFTATWESSLNPLNTVMDPIQKVTGVISGNMTGGNPLSTQSDYAETIWNWSMVLLFNSFLLFGLFLFFLGYIAKNKNNIMLSKLQFNFLSLWIFALAIFYVYYSIRTSFYTPYFGEFLPALALILAYVIVFLISEMETHNTFNRNMVKISLIIIIAFYISSLSLVSLSFQCVWSPNTVDEVSQYIKSHSVKEDVVLSGGMIWTLESNTRPFMNQTHPLKFLRGMRDDQIREIKIKIENEKPKFIVLDGYTEKIYLRNINNISDLINESYVLRKEVYGSEYPVKVYEIK